MPVSPFVKALAAILAGGSRFMEERDEDKREREARERQEKFDAAYLTDRQGQRDRQGLQDRLSGINPVPESGLLPALDTPAPFAGKPKEVPAESLAGTLESSGLFPNSGPRADQPLPPGDPRLVSGGLYMDPSQPTPGQQAEATATDSDFAKKRALLVRMGYSEIELDFAKEVGVPAAMSMHNATAKDQRDEIASRFLYDTYKQMAGRYGETIEAYTPGVNYGAQLTSLRNSVLGARVSRIENPPRRGGGRGDGDGNDRNPSTGQSRSVEVTDAEQYAKALIAKAPNASEDAIFNALSRNFPSVNEALRRRIAHTTRQTYTPKADPLAGFFGGGAAPAPRNASDGL